MLVEELAERYERISIGRRQQPATEPVPAGDLGDHGEEARPSQVAALAEDPVGGRAPLEATPFIGDRQAHLAWLRLDAELAEEPAEDGIVALVVDDEPGVDMVCLVGQIDPN